MSRNADDVENILLRLNRNYDREGKTIVLPGRGAVPPVALRVEPPILEVHVNIGPVPDEPERQLPLFRKLLELNANELVRAAYAIEHGHVVLTATHQVDHLDDEELEETLADIDMAVTRHVGELLGLADPEAPASRRLAAQTAQGT